MPSTPPILNTTPHPPAVRPDPLPTTLTPEAALAHTPADFPLTICWSGTSAHPESRWIILAPIESTIVDDLPAIVRDRIPINPPSPSSLPPTDLPPFAGGWIGFISFDAAGRFEPALQQTAPPAGTAWPSMVFHHTPGALIFDRLRRRWLSVGQHTSKLRELESFLAARANQPIPAHSFRLSLPADHQRSLTSARAHYTAAVRSALELIARGDIYQVNLAHALRLNFLGSSRALFIELMRIANPWMGAYIPLPWRLYTSPCPRD
ncbi:MAG: hypothetical protein IBJ18_10755 [Phycisphaerales bacterium]|nr:hypothetical protein [Phycisphaerales bacterium]